MSEKNVEIIHQVNEAFQRALEGDDPGAAFDTGLLSDDWEWVLASPFEGKSVWRGRQEYVEFLRAWTGEFEDFSIRFEQLIDASDDQVVIIYRQRGTGKGSGIPIELHGGMVSELRDGRVIKTTHYPDPVDALEAAGLQE